MSWFSNLRNWIDYNNESEPDPLPFDVMHLPLPDAYHARIERALFYTSKMTGSRQFVQLKLRLKPFDPKDEQVGWVIIGAYRYIKLLNQLGLKRTNDISVLEGHYVDVIVEEAPNAFNGMPMPKTILLEDITPKPKPKRRSTRARTPRKAK